MLADATDMRRRLAEAQEAAAANPWEVKLGPGRMMDIELLAQTGALIHDLGAPAQPAPDARRSSAPSAGSPRRTPPRWRRRSRRLAALQQIGRLASDQTIDPAEGGDGLVRLVLAATGQPDLDSLRRRLAAEARAQRRDHHRPAGAAR